MRLHVVRDRRHDQRRRELLTQDGRRGRRAADARQHAWHEHVLREGVHVAAETAFVARTTGEVAEPMRVDPFGSEPLEVAERHSPPVHGGSLTR